jgi:hypothetical protein
MGNTPHPWVSMACYGDSFALLCFCPKDGSSTLFRNVGELVPNYTVLQPRQSYFHPVFDLLGIVAMLLLLLLLLLKSC